MWNDNRFVEAAPSRKYYPPLTVVLCAVVRHVEVVRLRRVLGGEGVDLLHGRSDAGGLASLSYLRSAQTDTKRAAQQQ